MYLKQIEQQKYYGLEKYKYTHLFCWLIIVNYDFFIIYAKKM